MSIATVLYIATRCIHRHRYANRHRCINRMMDLIGTVLMPVGVCYLGYIIYLATQPLSSSFAYQSLYLLAGVYGLQILVFMV